MDNGFLMIGISKKELTSFYNDLLKKLNPNILQAMEKIIVHILILVIEDQNMALMKEINLQEVKEAMMSLPKNKAPRPDVFTSNFF